VRMALILHLTDENRQLMNDKIAVLEAFFLELRSTMESLLRHEDAPCSAVELERKQMALESEVEAIMNIPAPAPKKEEEKKEEAPADGDAPEGEEKPATDVDMKDEQPSEQPEAPAQ